MSKDFNAVWRNSGRKDYLVPVENQYQIPVQRRMRIIPITQDCSKE